MEVVPGEELQLSGVNSVADLRAKKVVLFFPNLRSSASERIFH